MRKHGSVHSDTLLQPHSAVLVSVALLLTPRPWCMHGAGRLLLFYTARRRDGTLCIGVAASASNLPTGPFADALGQPLLCRPDGAIDPHVFIDRRGDDATPHLLWKDDSNARGARTTIFLQRLRADGLGLEGAPKPLLSNDPAGWEGPLVEAPWLVLDTSSAPHYYFLFYSANAFNGPKYAVGVARATSLAGRPYVKRGAPILRTSRNASASPFAGPGHCAVVGAPGAGKALLFYHVWQRAGRWPAVGERGVPHVSVGGVRTWVERLWLGNRTRRGALTREFTFSSGS
ncbi:hypothetical protein EMIHUDRAFT_450854 [Emiliania huxleyi CCMP1516]|uniref:Uncharacterized protein n=2 Tax=Emiliania huxleyi TaxID=2903 RepID=A0A0D3JBP1_EMIH1|nr:hypothetical protein EMIHUDRAFT_450854 [Emiliania huxleyi CCMP1516]EOD20926.1 hypothetical protein EMIHUDRAFT_450854 [Emiliania huxleyi CCMP1516]|eukprot:XP_005773355.1 hypothetical protein EMIHUDRAFT_450854 [Emiliania huxleyi CCMP1516]